MSPYEHIRDYFLIGGHGAIAGWVLLVLLIASGSLSGGRLKVGVDHGVFVSVLVAAALTLKLSLYYRDTHCRLSPPSMYLVKSNLKEE